MKLTVSHRHKYPNGSWRLYYKCENILFCTATHGAHPDGLPFGTPGDRETKGLRIECHRAADMLMRARDWSKKDFYEWMYMIMSIPAVSAHIGRLNANQCRILMGKIDHELGVPSVRRDQLDQLGPGDGCSA